MKKSNPNQKSAGLIGWLRTHRFWWNLLWIAAILLALALIAHVVMLTATRHNARRTVPQMAGLALDEARTLAVQYDLELHINDSLYVPAYPGGTVLDQLPKGGVEVKPGRTVYLTINAFSQRMVDVPYVAGRSLRQAKNMLEIAGLEIAELVYRPDMATNYVLEEFYGREQIHPASRVRAEAGSGITLHVGLGEEAPASIVPKVVGLGLRQAKSRLWEQGLNVGRVRYDEGINLLNEDDARVYAQSATPSSGLRPGSRVDLTLTLDGQKITSGSRSADQAARAAAEEMRRAEEALADSTARALLDSLSRTAAEPAPEAEEEILFEEYFNDDEFFQ